MSVPVNLLENLEYPSPVMADDQEPLNVKLARRMEFLELASTIPNSLRPRYVATDYDPVFLHQPITLRLAIQQDRILVIFPPGSGKTCTAVNIPEYLRKYHIGPDIKRVYILQRGPSVIADVKNQIVNVCAKEIYGFEESESGRANRRRTTNALSAFYTIQTYNTFSSLQLPDDLIEQTYSDSVFIIDEAHNLIGWNKDAASPETVQEAEASGDEIMSKKDVIRAYRYIHRVVHLAKRAKVIVMTATPMINWTSEFGKLLNLVLPMDRQIPMTGPGQINFDTISQAEFNRLTEGLISYVPNRQTSVTIKDIGLPTPGYYSILTKVPMLGIQRQTYRKIVQESDKANFGAMEHRKASFFVFPDGSYDGIPGVTNRGLFKYITVPETDKYVPKESFRQDIRDLLPELSAPGNYIIQKELRPDRVIDLGDGHRLTLPGRGCAYVLFDLVTAHAIPFTMALEAFGFERYNDGHSPFSYVNGLRTINLDKRPRYIFLTVDNVTSKLQNFKDLFNSEENVFGEYVQLIIGSRVIRDGINIFNVARIYITPLWNPSNEEQALARAKRLPGHRKVIERSRQLMRQAGFPEEKIQAWKFVLEQHRMSSFDPEPLNLPAQPMNAKNSIVSSIDQHMFLDIIEDKAKYINRVMQMAIENSIDRYLNTDAPPFPVDQSQIDYSSFDALYSGRLVLQIKRDILDLFGDSAKGNSHYDIETLRRLIWQVTPTILRRDKYIYLALAEMVKEKTVLRDRYGNKTWVHVKDDYVFISNAYPDGQIKILDSYYRRMIVARPNPIKESVLSYCLNNINQLLDVPFEINSNLANMIVLEYLTVLLIRRFPEARKKDWWNKENPMIHPNLQRSLNNLLFAFWKPFQDLKHASYLLSLPSLNKGIKAAEDSKTKLKTMIFHPEPEGPALSKDISLPLVLIHNMDTTRGSNQLRVLEANQSNQLLAWRDVYVYEEDVYGNLIDARQEQLLSKFPVGKLFGMVQLNGTLIVGRREKSLAQIDKRLQAKGKACPSITKEDLIDMLNEEGRDSGQEWQDLSHDTEEAKSILCQRLLKLLEAGGRILTY